MNVKTLRRPISFNKKLLLTGIFLVVVVAISMLLVVTAASIEDAVQSNSQSVPINQKQN